jgi:hypothetical protein
MTLFISMLRYPGRVGVFILAGPGFSKRMSLGPTIEEFASQHQLPARWLELRKTCNRLVARADFWYRADLRNEARQLAVEASDILHSALAQRDRLAPGQASEGSEPVLTRQTPTVH